MRYTRIPYNKMAFLPEEQKQCTDLIKFLLNSKSDEYFNEICISYDTYCTIVYWIRKPIKEEFVSGSFEYVDGDEDIYTEKELDEIVDTRIKYALENAKHVDNELK